mmetsp:Transcript_28062/g.84614  ORF Transcript_28062/g.84614 Transcript_28062/m.84614 type:complete len:938 (-) Transcript_28062:468-3281(-)
MVLEQRLGEAPRVAEARLLVRRQRVLVSGDVGAHLLRHPAAVPLAERPARPRRGAGRPRARALGLLGLLGPAGAAARLPVGVQTLRGAGGAAQDAAPEVRAEEAGALPGQRLRRHAHGGCHREGRRRQGPRRRRAGRAARGAGAGAAHRALAARPAQLEIVAGLRHRVGPLLVSLADDLVDLRRLVPPLDLHQVQPPAHHGIWQGLVRRAGANHPDAVDLAQPCQPTGQVHGVAQAAKLHFHFAADIASEHGACVDPDVYPDLRQALAGKLLGELAGCLLLRQRCRAGFGRVALDAERRVPEHQQARRLRHDLPDDAVEALHDPRHDREVSGQHEEEVRLREVLGQARGVLDHRKHDGNLPGLHVEPRRPLVALDDVPHHGLGDEPREGLRAARQRAEGLLQLGDVPYPRELAVAEALELARLVREVEVRQPPHQVAQALQRCHHHATEAEAERRADGDDAHEQRDAEDRRVPGTPPPTMGEGVQVRADLADDLLALLAERGGGQHDDHEPPRVPVVIQPQRHGSDFDAIAVHAEPVVGRLQALGEQRLVAVGLAQSEGRPQRLGPLQPLVVPRVEPLDQGLGGRADDGLRRAHRVGQVAADHRQVCVGGADEHARLVREPRRVHVDDEDRRVVRPDDGAFARRLLLQRQPMLLAVPADALQPDVGRHHALEARVVAAEGDGRRPRQPEVPVDENVQLGPGAGRAHRPGPAGAPRRGLVDPPLHRVEGPQRRCQIPALSRRFHEVAALGVHEPESGVAGLPRRPARRLEDLGIHLAGVPCIPHHDAGGLLVLPSDVQPVQPRVIASVPDLSGWTGRPVRSQRPLAADFLPRVVVQTPALLEAIHTVLQAAELLDRAHVAPHCVDGVVGGRLDVSLYHNLHLRQNASAYVPAVRAGEVRDEPPLRRDGRAAGADGLRAHGARELLQGHEHAAPRQQHD